MTTEKTPTAIGKFLRGNLVKNIIAPFVRGAVKIGLPVIGTPIVEILSNLTGAKRKDLVTGADQPKHSYTSIIIQVTIAIAVIIAVYTKAITLQEVIALLKQFLPTP